MARSRRPRERASRADRARVLVPSASRYEWCGTVAFAISRAGEPRATRARARKRTLVDFADITEACVAMASEFLDRRG